MKITTKTLAALALILLPLCLSAQTYKPFRLGVGIGFSKEKGSSGIGTPFYIEPSYQFSRYAVALRMEAMYKTSSSAFDFNFVSSYSLNGQYYFLANGDVRMFAGLGLGVYSPSQTASVFCDCSENGEKNLVGFYPRVGFDYGHFTMGLEYNFISQNHVTTRSIMPGFSSTDTYNINNSYLSLKIGLWIGGGRRLGNIE